MSSWCQKLTMLLPEGYVLYKDKIVFYLRFKRISHDVEVLKSEH